MNSILVTGDLGMVGSAVRLLFGNKNRQYKNLNLLVAAKPEYDLRDEQSVKSLYEAARPDYVIHCAAVVGGVKFNKEHPDVLFRDNVLINTHMIHYAHHYDVKKLIAFSSACAFQDGVYPFKEEDLQNGKPYEGNLAYGYAKRMVDVQIGIYNKLYGRKDLTVIPTSIYGPADNFSVENGHFVAGLIAKTYKAKMTKTPLRIWGDGSPLRELLYSKDLAKILIELILQDTPDKLLIPGEEVSVLNVVNAITDIMDFKGEIIWETDKPNGQHRKPTDPTRFKKVVKDFSFTTYLEGLKETINWYCERKLRKWRIRGEGASPEQSPADQR